MNCKIMLAQEKVKNEKEVTPYKFHFFLFFWVRNGLMKHSYHRTEVATSIPQINSS